MPDYAQIITHTSEQTLQWHGLCRSNPGRVSRTLVLRAGQRTREGDNQGDIYPAIEAVKAISMIRGANNPAWVNLVEGGIADALCKNVPEMVTFLQTLLGMPQELRDRVTNELPSPYFTPLEILCNAACNFQYPSTKTDRKVIAALRKNWSEMMDRIWNEPENTLRPEDSHTRERIVVAQIVARLLITDPNFTGILYEPSDLTVQIIARHWKYSRKNSDMRTTSSILYALIDPSEMHPRQEAYFRSNGLDAKLSQIIPKILLGVSPTVHSSKQQQAKTLLAAFAENLLRSTGHTSAHQLDLLMIILHVARDRAKEDDAIPEVTKAALRSTPLWSALFRLLKKSAKPGPSDESDPEQEKAHRLRFMRSAVGVAANTLHDASFDNPDQCEPLLRIWANENFFGALEETIEILITRPGMAMQLTRLASGIETTVDKGSPALQNLYRAQFPHWRIIGTLIRNDIKKQQVAGPPPPYILGQIAPPDSTVWDHAAWQCFGSLQFRCMDRTLCGKRGCENPGNIACMCQVLKYCSEDCKTKDAKDHQLACGLLGLLEKIINEVSQSESAPRPAGTASGKKKKKSRASTTGSGPASTASGADPQIDELD
ncbi:hypothetical protein BOTBODRAFT_70311 [Botryobasidium botryosum FD-172 SS1]|uniref:MYND-type domain-containing protein n=1 Tax=Botryobasidium botryosum (strain FD-172 SS1) TaxID=930990 RepID=A0A067LZ14_BOTB1|nr:hypothetical protein BOTBODRAFT_70311 [Botryobasidium botryosum FD-172 SS1]